MFYNILRYNFKNPLNVHVQEVFKIYSEKNFHVEILQMEELLRCQSHVLKYKFYSVHNMLIRSKYRVEV